MPSLKLLEAWLPQGLEFQEAQFLKASGYKCRSLPMGRVWSLSLSETAQEAQLGEAVSAEDWASTP